MVMEIIIEKENNYLFSDSLSFKCLKDHVVHHQFTYLCYQCHSNSFKVNQLFRIENRCAYSELYVELWRPILTVAVI